VGVVWRDVYVLCVEAHDGKWPYLDSYTQATPMTYVAVLLLPCKWSSIGLHVGGHPRHAIGPLAAGLEMGLITLGAVPGYGVVLLWAQRETRAEAPKVVDGWVQLSSITHPPAQGRAGTVETLSRSQTSKTAPLQD
jgi:hypothetical protein